MHVTTVRARVRSGHCAGISRPLPRRGTRNSHRFNGLEALVHRFTRIDARHDSPCSSQIWALRGNFESLAPSGDSKFPSLQWTRGTSHVTYCRRAFDVPLRLATATLCIMTDETTAVWFELAMMGRVATSTA